MLLKKDKPKIVFPETEKINLKFSILKSLAQRTQNIQLFGPQIKELETVLSNLDVDQVGRGKTLDAQRAYQIQREIRYLQIQIIKPVLELDRAVLQGLDELRLFLASQFAELSIKQKLDWLDTFSTFIVTPDIRTIYKRIADMAENYQPLGQQENFLLGGESGNGKTSLLQLFASYNLPYCVGHRKIRPVVMIDAPPFETAKKALPRMLLEGVGGAYEPREEEPPLYQRAAVLCEVCQTVILIVDEAQNLARYDLRRRFINFSNQSSRPIICASNEIGRFREGDDQTKGRWGNPYILKPYSGGRLTGLLGYIDLLLPFPEKSDLALMDGPAKLIETKTGGILRDILKLVVRCSRKAIKAKKSRLTMKDLQETADDLNL